MDGGRREEERGARSEEGRGTEALGREGALAKRMDGVAAHQTIEGIPSCAMRHLLPSGHADSAQREGKRPTGYPLLSCCSALHRWQRWPRWQHGSMAAISAISAISSCSSIFSGELGGPKGISHPGLGWHQDPDYIN